MAGRTIWLRVVLLAVLAVGANLWLERHIGHGIENPVGLLGLAGSMTVLSAVLDWSLKDAEKEEVRAFTRGKVREIVRRVLSTPVLVLLFFLGGILAATYSSVTILPARGAASGKVTVTPIDEPDAAESKAVGSAPTRIFMETNPLGRDLRLAVDGYIPKRVTLFPLVGLSIDVDNDLEPLPTLLFRPTVDAIVSLKSGGRFVIFRTDDDACERLGASSAGDHSARAFVVGSKRAIPSNLAALWNLELVGGGHDAGTTAEMLRAWLKPEAVEVNAMLEPGDRVYAVVLTRAGKPKVDAALTVGREPFQDIAMTSAGADLPMGCAP
ncbi:MAG: hypothetical protein AB7P52_03470 [Alphaproteobacteria bacterium]